MTPSADLVWQAYDSTLWRLTPDAQDLSQKMAGWQTVGRKRKGLTCCHMLAIKFIVLKSFDRVLMLFIIFFVLFQLF